MQVPAAKGAGITLRLRRKFPKPPTQVFQAWTQPEALKRWWCPPGWQPAGITVDVRAGGSYRIEMRRTSDGKLVSIEGRFLEVAAPSKLVYTWRWLGVLEQMPETIVTVEFLPVDQGTEIVLTHDNFPDVPSWQQHRGGWIAACDRMERIL
jgi:uncharacterized protein YndB with AHSA1/START domain